LEYNRHLDAGIMHTTTLRKVGGSVMLALPPALLDLLHLQAGSIVAVAIDDGRLTIEPKRAPRYTMAELLAVSDYTAEPRDQREWLDAPAVGGEPL
jgi:antitoxin ChpS